MGTPLQLRPQPVGQGSGRCRLAPQNGPSRVAVDVPLAAPCSKYQLEQIAVNTDDVGWSTVAVTVQELRPGDLIELLTRAGEDELASRVAALVTEHGVREGLRLLGLSYR